MAGWRWSTARPCRAQAGSARSRATREVGGQAHRSGRVEATIHLAQIVGDARPEAHLPQDVALEIDARRDLGQHEPVVLEGEDRALRDVTDLLAAFLIAFVLGMALFGSMVGLYAAAPSLYPAAIRTTGMGWAIGMGRVGAILAPFCAGLLVDSGWDTIGLYAAFAVPVALAVLARRMRWSMRMVVGWGIAVVTAASLFASLHFTASDPTLSYRRSPRRQRAHSKQPCWPIE